MALKPNQLQVTATHLQENAIIERVYKDVNYMLRSFDLNKNHKNLEKQENNPFDYFLQSTLWLSSYLKHLSYNIEGNTIPTCVRQRYIHSIAFRANWD
jgi:hypothetical protein